MAERDVWVKAKIVEEGDERAARVMTGSGAYERYFWVDKASIRPRTDATAPDAAPDALRAACESLLAWFTNGHADDDLAYTALKENVNALRAALAEAEPVEGPVQLGDTVRLEGEVVEIRKDEGTAVIRVPTTGLRTVWLFDLTIVSRAAPKPAERCEHCRWFCTCGHMVYGCSYPEYAPKHHDPNHAICGFFEPWPGA